MQNSTETMEHRARVEGTNESHTHKHIRHLQLKRTSNYKSFP